MELSKRLKDLGVKQESLFYWIVYPDGESILMDQFHAKKEDVNIRLARECRINGYERIYGLETKIYSAFIIGELGEMLPDYCVFNKSTERPNQKHGWYAKANKNIDPQFAFSEANARAKMLIYLLENRLMKID